MATSLRFKVAGAIEFYRAFGFQRPTMKLYLAGPLFTAAEQEFNRQLAAAFIKAGHEVWLPQEHEPRERTARAIFEEDLKGFDWAEVLVANMDGPDPDSGTCWECGYAFRRKLIILYRTDFRLAGDTHDTPFNLMMSESANALLMLPLASPEQVAERVCEELLKLRA
jgi:nucleoside 2-deoxyribosyltransferase